jgi:hypothetical protein
MKQKFSISPIGQPLFFYEEDSDLFARIALACAGLLFLCHFIILLARG